MSDVDYSKLRLDVLEKMVYSRGIECKMKKDEIVKVLKLDDEGKYEPPMNNTVYEKTHVDKIHYTKDPQVKDLMLKNPI